MPHKPSNVELQAEIRRLQELLAAVEERASGGPAANDMGVAGRVAITRLRDTDMVELVAAVDDIPRIYQRHGYLAALAYTRFHVRKLTDALILAPAPTADLVRAQHRLHMMLNEGEADIMMRSDRAGLRARMDFLECVERYAFAGSVRSAFAHGAETPAGLVPPTFGGD